jgi:hypothetical protein
MDAVPSCRSVPQGVRRGRRGYNSPNASRPMRLARCQWSLSLQPGHVVSCQGQRPGQVVDDQRQLAIVIFLVQSRRTLGQPSIKSGDMFEISG